LAEAQGNGGVNRAAEAQAEAEPAPVATPVDEVYAPEEVSPRTCRGCGQPLDGPETKVWCSQSCRNRYRPRGFVDGQADGDVPVSPRPPPREDQVVGQLIAIARAHVARLTVDLGGVRVQVRSGPKT
jgi:hypothetical protein